VMVVRRRGRRRVIVVVVVVVVIMLVGRRGRVMMSPPRAVASSRRSSNGNNRQKELLADLQAVSIFDDCSSIFRELDLPAWASAAWSMVVVVMMGRRHAKINKLATTRDS